MQKAPGGHSHPPGAFSYARSFGSFRFQRPSLNTTMLMSMPSSQLSSSEANTIFYWVRTDAPPRLAQATSA